MFFIQLPRFMDGTRSWRTQLVPYRKNMKLTISYWFWLPPVFPVFSLAQFCSFYHITASTVSSTLSKTFWVVPKEVNMSEKYVWTYFYFHSFPIAVQIEMPELWTCGTKNPVIQSSHTPYNNKQLSDLKKRLRKIFCLEGMKSEK